MNTILAAQPAAGSNMSFLLMMVIIFAIMWFFMIRPQQKRQKEIRQFQNSITEGTKVVTGGGVHGTVKRVNADTTVDVEIARGVVVTIDRNYVFASGAAATPNA